MCPLQPFAIAASTAGGNLESRSEDYSNVGDNSSDTKYATQGRSCSHECTRRNQGHVDVSGINDGKIGSVEPRIKRSRLSHVPETMHDGNGSSSSNEEDDNVLQTLLVGGHPKLDPSSLVHHSLRSARSTMGTKGTPE